MSGGHQRHDQFSSATGKSNGLLPGKNMAFPAWIAADENGVAYPAASLGPRVRKAPVLRQGKNNKTAGAKGASNARGAR